MVMVVPKESPYSTLKEFLDYAKTNPGKITYSSGGPATNNHLSTAYLAGKQGLDMVHVPFGGGQAALTAVLSKIGRHAFRQLVRPDRAGAKRHCEGAGGLDQGAYAATAGCADGGKPCPATSTWRGTAMP